MKIDTNGTLLWERHVWGYISDVNGIAKSSDGGYFAVGGGDWRWPGVCTLRVDGEGKRIWEDAWTPERIDAQDILGSVNGVYVIAGNTAGPKAYLVGLREAAHEPFAIPAFVVVSVWWSLATWIRAHGRSTRPQGSPNRTSYPSQRHEGITLIKALSTMTTISEHPNHRTKEQTRQNPNPRINV